MRITQKTHYALLAVLRLARMQRSASGPRPTSIDAIAQSEEIPATFLEQILYRLGKAGIVKSVRGPGGGFQLLREPAQITVNEVLEALEENITPTPCTACTDQESVCPRQEGCIARGLWMESAKAFRDYFQRITLKDVLDDYPRKGPAAP